VRNGNLVCINPVRESRNPFAASHLRPPASQPAAALAGDSADSSPDDIMTFWDCLWRTLIVLTLLTAGSILGLIAWEVLFGIGNWPRRLSG
jgi:hypothetical protein